MRRTGSLDTDTTIDPQGEDQGGAGGSASTDDDGHPVLMRAPRTSKPNDPGSGGDGGTSPQPPKDATPSPQ
jgi:hypothetical protein